MEENKLAYVRGNDVLFIVTVTTPERDEYGQPVYGDDELQLVPVDFTGWDDYSLRVVKQGVTRTIVAESSQLVEGEDGKIVVDVPYTAQCGTYSLELVGRQNGRHERSYEIMMFEIVESNDKANLIYEIIDGYKSADLDITVQMVSSALVYGENAYQMWKHLPGNEDKTLQDYIDEVLDLVTITENARHPDYVGEDNYVYRWDTETQSYYNTDIYVKGERGLKGDKGDKGDTGATGATGAQGIQGEQGEKGDPFTYSDFTAEQLAALRGPQGDKGDKGDPMRYEDLSPAQIESLKGPKGDTGQQGVQGPAGQNGLTPTIDSTSKHWMIGSTDTGVVAEGQDGQDGQNGTNGTNGVDGVTPHIDSSNKHWMIGTEDTGVVAEGQDGRDGTNGTNGTNGTDGADGITPHIDSTTGNWFIGDENTGVHAQGPQGVPGQNGQDGRDGQNGITPHIDETTGDWFVGDEDTGVHAQGPQGVQGQQGPQGVPGQDGRDGQDGHGVPTGGVTGQVLKKKSNTDYDTEWGAGGGGASYTPTLDSAPTSSTTTYVKDGETVDFEVGQFARVANVNGWDMYQLYDVTNGVATWEKCENIHADHEDVFIVVTTDVQGVSVSGLVINAYYNGATAVSASVTTDSQGMASLQVPNGYQYKLVFPDIAGCKSIEPIVHTATVAQRSIEVEYVEQPQLVEAVTVELSQILMDVYTPLSGKTVSVTSGGTTTTYTTDAQGKVQFEIAIGTQYTVTAPQIEDKYIRTGGYTRTYVAERSVRVLNFIYRTYDSGLFVVASDGAEYALNDWETAVAGGTRQNSEAKLIKVATAALIQAGGVFYFDIDDMRNKNYEKKTWESQNILLSSIPQNGNSASSNYYYDGYTASTKIQEECTERGLQCAATSHCLEQQYTGISGATLKGFLGSIGQLQVMWSARIEIDEILQSVRPNGTYLLSGFTDQKWSSTQYSASNAWHWTSAANNNNKFTSYFVVPFFAY